MHFNYIKVLHSPFVFKFYIGELLKEQPDEFERTLDRKLKILDSRADSTADSSDTLHRPFPSLGLSLPIYMMMVI